MSQPQHTQPLRSNAARPFFVGIAGGSGAGKTTAAIRLAEAFPSRVLLLSLDDYYRDQSAVPLTERERINFDHPDAIEWQLLRHHIKRLLAGKPIVAPQYDFKTHTRIRNGRPLEAQEVVILEGNLALCDEPLTKMMDLRIYVETDADVRVLRRIERDIQQRGRTVASVVNQYLSSVKPMHMAFVEPSKARADLVMQGDGGEALDRVKERISAHLGIDG